MRFRLILNVLLSVSLLLMFTHSIWCQESEQTAPPKKSRGGRGMFQLSDQDVLLPITSIEWGIPDRWSFTSRYIHMFQKNRDDKTWLHNLSVSLSPGTAGGRFGLGYQGIIKPILSRGDFGIFSEARAVLLRTWGNPLVANPNHTFVGGEIRVAIVFIINFGFGYYYQISGAENDQDQFYGFHLGVGI